MPMQSQAQWGYLFANKKPFADRWAKQTPGGKGARFRRLPYRKVKKDIVGTVSTAVAPRGPGGLMSAPGMGTPKRTRKKAFTIQQLEAFVCSPHYDPATAAAIASGIPELPRLKGEQIAPGITRIHGNLCNVHGRYGKCPGAAVAPPPKTRRGRKPRKPKKIALTSAQRTAAREATHATNRKTVLRQLNIAPDGQQALEALRSGSQPDPQAIARGGFMQAGLVERARDGSYRLSASGRAALAAANAGDVGRAGDIISSARDRATARNERQAAHVQRQQAAQAKREQAAQLRAKRLARRMAKQTTKAQSDEEKAMFAKMGGGGGGGGSGGGGKGGGKNTAWPKGPGGKRVPTKANAQAALQSYQKRSNLASEKKRDAIKLDAHASMAKRRGDTAEADRLSTQAKKLHAESRALDLHKRAIPELRTIERAGYHMSSDGKRLVPSKHSTTPKMKAAPSFRVFKDATGRARWVAQSSTAYQDRDQEIVSTKALADDCAFADRTGTYGPLRWWHTPGLDLGDCDFNAMHGKVLIESGTFRSPMVAQKVAAAADALEISLGFLHLPTEPDASGVFHHIRKFERSLVPRGKASNRFTAFRVKELLPMDEKKIAYLRTELKFSDTEIAEIQASAAATEKAAADQNVAFKADEPAPPDEITIGGVVYTVKAFPPKAAGAPPEGSPEEEAAESPEEEQAEMDAGEGDASDAGGLTLSPEDLDAIGQAVGTAIQGVASQIMGALDLEKKVAGHVQGLMAPFQAQKDATDAERAEQIATLQTSLKAAQEQQAVTQAKLDELLGLQPAVQPRATQAAQSIVNPFNPADNKLLQSIKEQVPPDQLPQYTNEFEDLKIKLFGS